MITDVAFSPCPNDTFLFYHFLAKDKKRKAHLADIETLNNWLFQEKFPLCKASVATFVQKRDVYTLLPVGCALGFNAGPKLVAKRPFRLEDLPEKKVAIPGKNTTAHFLLQLFAKSPQEKIFTSYEKIVDLIANDEVDAGLLIHETRFLIKDKGFFEIADLGLLWEQKTNLPLPLGCLAAKKELGKKTMDRLTKELQESLLCAWKDPIETLPYVLTHSQEKKEKIVEEHINLYVTRETLALSPQGKQSIELMAQFVEEIGITT